MTRTRPAQHGPARHVRLARAAGLSCPSRATPRYLRRQTRRRERDARARALSLSASREGSVASKVAPPSFLFSPWRPASPRRLTCVKDWHSIPHVRVGYRRDYRHNHVRNLSRRGPRVHFRGREFRDTYIWGYGERPHHKHRARGGRGVRYLSRRGGRSGRSFSEAVLTLVLHAVHRSMDHVPARRFVPAKSDK